MVLSKHTITCHGWCYLPVFRHIVTYCTLCTLENWQRQYKSPRYVLKYGTMLYDPWVRYEWEYSGALVRLFPGFMWRIRRVPITRIIIKPHISFVKIWNLLSSSNIVARKGYFWSSLHSGNVTHRSSSNPSSVESVFICLAANTRLPIYFQGYWIYDLEIKSQTNMYRPYMRVRVPNVARSLALISCLPYCHVPQNNFAMCLKIAELQSAKLLLWPSLVGPHVSKNCCCNNQLTVQKNLCMYCLCIVFDNAQCDLSCLVWTHHFVLQ